MSPASDPVLWRRAVAGDAHSFGVLYERHDRAVLSFCLWRTGDPALAEDLTSAVFLEAWRRRASTPLTGDDARPLLLAIATNVLRTQWRTRRRHRAALDRLGRATEPRPDHDDDAAERIDAAARLHEVRTQLDGLPVREREVLALVALADLTYEETAAALGLPIGTVRSRLSRARSRLGAGPLTAVDASPTKARRTTARPAAGARDPGRRSAATASPADTRRAPHHTSTETPS